VRKIFITLAAFTLIGAAAAPALAQGTSTATGHILFSAATSISFSFTSSDMTDLGALTPDGAVKNGSGSYQITSNAPWSVSLTPGSIPNGVTLTANSNHVACSAPVTLVSNTATADSPCFEPSWRSGGGSGGTFTDSFTGSQNGGLAPASYNVPIAYVASN
jgi:hypothetical protein